MNTSYGNPTVKISYFHILVKSWKVHNRVLLGLKWKWCEERLGLSVQQKQ